MRWLRRIFLVIGAVLFVVYEIAYVQTGVNVQWRGFYSWLIYAGVPLVELVFVALIASRSKSRLDNSLVALWGLDGVNFVASIVGVFGAY